MNNIYPVHGLLQQVTGISRKYDEIAAITGERFNLFSIMHRETSEDWGHSALIAELLSSQGTHGQGNKFLTLLLDYINRNVLKKDQEPIAVPDQYQVKPKKRIGVINQDCTTGGEIDICIESSDHCLIIENKIYAIDQPNQLLRYHNYGVRKQKCWLIYLTLDGRAPEPKTTGVTADFQQKVIAISYEKHILAWLELCKREVADFPLLRESLTQYIYLVKKLTNQSTNQKMEQEIVSSIIKDSDSIAAALTIRSALDKIYDPLLDILKKQLRQLGETKGFTIKDDNWGSSTRKEEESYYYFYLPNSQYGVNITLGFDAKNCIDFSVGVYSDHADLKPDTERFKQLQIQLLHQLRFIGEPATDHLQKHLYVCYKPNNDESLTAWTSHEIWKGIPNGQTADKLMQLVLSIYEAINNLEL